MIIDIFSVSDKKNLDILYVQLNSIKQMKLPDTIIHYSYFIEDINDENKEYFNDLISPDFNIQFIDARKYEKQINCPENTYLYYIRCLAPRIFKNKDKILYFDSDVLLVDNRLEELWSTSIEGCFLAATLDIEENYRDKDELKNVMKYKDYFNAGVMLMNLKEIRKHEYDLLLAQYLLKWPNCLRRTLHDQTLLNWFFHYSVKIISTDFNNSILSMRLYDMKHYQNFYKTKNLYGEVKKACILHFKGDKVWKILSKEQKSILPYYALGRTIYLNLYNKYAKKIKNN